MIKSIKTLPSQVSSIEVSDESDIESLGTEYGVGSTVRVTGQISAEYILTPDGWMRIAGGGATSLNDLSDVKISEPLEANQILIYFEGDVSAPGRFLNRRIHITDLAGISFDGDIGASLLWKGGSTAAFDYYQCVESPIFDASVAQAFEQVIAALKPAAKSAGKAGAKVPVANAAGIVSQFVTIQDTKKRVPVAIFGDYVFFPKGRISSTKFLFSSADTDGDGVYDIIFAIDTTVNAAYVTVEYTACPAMS